MMKLPEDCEGFPALCIWASDDDKEVGNTAHKEGNVRVLVLGYESGGDLAGKIETLAQDFEAAVEALPDLGITAGAVRSPGARVTKISTNSLGVDGEGQTHDFFEAEVTVPYRHTLGSP